MNEQTTTNPLHAAIADLSGEVIALVRPGGDEALRIAGAAGPLGDPDVLAADGVAACEKSSTKGGA
jgi:hypothetical protein